MHIRRNLRAPGTFLWVILAALLMMALAGMPSNLVAQSSAMSKLTVHIVGAKDSNGQIAIALFNGELGFPGDKTKASRTLQVKIDPKTMSAQIAIDDLPRGVYAISVFHDENMNGQLDKNLFGVPKEGYGFSNVLKKSMGPPKFADAKFQLVQPEQIVEIKLLY